MLRGLSDEFQDGSQTGVKELLDVGEGRGRKSLLQRVVERERFQRFGMDSLFLQNAVVERESVGSIHGMERFQIADQL